MIYKPSSPILPGDSFLSASRLVDRLEGASMES